VPGAWTHRRAVPVPGTDSKRRELVETNCCGARLLIRRVGPGVGFGLSRQEDRGPPGSQPPRRPASPFEDVISEPASHVQQTTLSDVAGCELSQAVGETINGSYNSVPSGGVRGSRWAFSRKAQASPPPVRLPPRGTAPRGISADFGR